MRSAASLALAMTAPRFPAGLAGAVFYSHGCKLLGGLYLAAGATPRPTVLLLHGLPGVDQNLDLAYALRDAGFNCLFFHYRGCWGSGGVYSLAGVVDDVRAATDWVLEHPAVDPTRLALAGNSLGGYATLAAGAVDARYKALAPLCPLIDPAESRLSAADFAEFATMLSGVSGPELAAQWQALTPVTRFADRLADRPILLVTGDRDEFFPPEHYQAFPGGRANITWQRFAEGDHIFTACRPQLVQTIVAWLHKTL